VAGHAAGGGFYGGSARCAAPIERRRAVEEGRACPRGREIPREPTGRSRGGGCGAVGSARNDDLRSIRAVRMRDARPEGRDGAARAEDGGSARMRGAAVARRR